MAPSVDDADVQAFAEKFLEPFDLARQNPDELAALACKMAIHHATITVGSSKTWAEAFAAKVQRRVRRLAEPQSGGSQN